MKSPQFGWRIILAILAFLVLGTVNLVVAFNPYTPEVVNQAAAKAVNGNAADFQAARAINYTATQLLCVTGGIQLAIMLLLFVPPLLRIAKSRAIGAGLLLVFVAACKPYDTPEYKEVKPNETAFLVPLEDDAKDQERLKSEAYLEKAKVAAKRIQIPHRWNQTGRGGTDGEWIATHRLIIVSRAPITREWTAEAHRGTNAKDESFHTESRDSVNFTVGASVTAYVAEEDTAKFLYLTGTDSLQTVIDTEVRNRIQSIVTEYAGKSDLETLRTQKAEMLGAIRTDIVPFFKTRGVTIMTTSLASGFDYENKEIQNSIDRVFQAQQLKQISKAELDAQSDTNKKIEMAADAQAAAKLKIAETDAKALQIMNEAAGKGSAAVFLKAIEKWDGKLPTFFQSGAGGPIPMLPIAPEK